MNRKDKIKLLQEIAAGRKTIEELKPLRLTVRRFIIGKDHEVLEIQERTVLIERGIIE